MEISQRSYSSTEREDPSIINELYELVFHNQPEELKFYLQSKPDIISYIFTHIHRSDVEHYSFLMLASLRGYDAIVDILLQHCPNCINQIALQGHVYGVNGVLIKNATALWCALDRGHFTIAKTLIDLGKANADDGTSTPFLIEAVFRERLDIVQFLVENDYVDINGTVTRDRNKYTSLIAAASLNNTQILTYIIEKGAELDYRTYAHDDTALTTAIKRGHLASVKLLCSAGASCGTANRFGDTPLILAIKNDHVDIVDTLVEHTHDDIAFNFLERNAAFFILSDHDGQRQQHEFMMRLLQQSIQRREQFNVPKTIIEPVAAYDFHKECQSIDELDKIKHDRDRLYIEALLIQERLLLPVKDVKLFEPLLTRVIVLVERNEFDRALHLALHTFHLYQQLKLETKIHRFVWIFCRILHANVHFPVHLFLAACNLLFEPSQQKSDDETLNNALYLAVIATKVLEQEAIGNKDRDAIIRWIQELCRQQRIMPTGQTLLHLSVDSRTNNNINYRSDDITPAIVFPNLAVTKLFLKYGRRWIDVDATDGIRGDTALHLISRCSIQDTDMPSEAIAKLLINEGAHADCINKYGETPIDVATNNLIKSLLRLRQSPSLLKCRCARLIIDQKVPYEQLWPKETLLNKFLFLHGGLKCEHALLEDDLMELFD
ncbi:unnamed protein product [Rotaria socialis]|uniref:Uncharacterized protein n=1 Tax=Rotaria socialis TaxID=392032 RepID=A0A820VNP0_9BILA|nr:unnamed protein product [Rotaria socialis]CAF4504625.1 unnamed protein product [Rotaria socialis]